MQRPPEFEPFAWEESTSPLTMLDSIGAFAYACLAGREFRTIGLLESEDKWQRAQVVRREVLDATETLAALLAPIGEAISLNAELFHFLNLQLRRRLPQDGAGQTQHAPEVVAAEYLRLSSHAVQEELPEIGRWLLIFQGYRVCGRLDFSSIKDAEPFTDLLTKKSLARFEASL